MKKLKFLWQYMEGNRALYVMSIVAVAFAIFLRNVWPLVLRVTIDSIIGGKPIETSGWLQPAVIKLFNLMGDRSTLVQSLWMCSLVLVVLTISRGIFLFFKGKLSAQASEAIARNIRDKVYDHLQHLPFDYHVKAKTGDLVQRCTSDVNTIRAFLAVQFVEIGRAIFMIGFALSFMLPMSGKMTLVSMIMVPFLFLFSYLFFKKVRVLFKASDEAEGHLSAVLQENLTGVRVVRAFGRQSFEIDKFEKSNMEYRKTTFKLINLLAVYWGASDFLALLQIAAVTVLGTYWAATGEISLGTMLAFGTYVGMLLWPVRQMGRVLTDLGKTMVSIERIQEILDVPIEEFDTRATAAGIKGELEFTNVSFEYESGKPILKDISFKAKAGETIAILGATGSGKSTLVNLLPRLYDYQMGSIKIDGKELKEYDKKAIRCEVGIVLQEPFLFSKSLKENIGIAQSNFSDDQVYDAARVASVHDVIEGFDKGYETSVGERGVTLSGGQKQRVAIARTIINDCPILIFDDSLSAVDTETDAAIRAELKKRNHKATTFIISHRVTTLAEADLILVLEEGLISQRGTHDDLIAEDGLYQRIWALQNSLEKEFEIDTKTYENKSRADQKIS